MMSSYSLLFMHHVADNSCFHPQIPPPFEAHTLLLSMAHSGERKSHNIPALQCLSCSPSPPSLLQVKGGDWKKECLYLDDGSWWGGKSASHCIWWHNAYITGSRILTFYPREIGAINRELSKMLDAVHLLILFFSIKLQAVDFLVLTELISF